MITSKYTQTTINAILVCWAACELFLNYKIIMVCLKVLEIALLLYYAITIQNFGVMMMKWDIIYSYYSFIIFIDLISKFSLFEESDWSQWKSLFCSTIINLAVICSLKHEDTKLTPVIVKEEKQAENCISESVDQVSSRKSLSHDDTCKSNNEKPNNNGFFQSLVSPTNKFMMNFLKVPSEDKRKPSLYERRSKKILGDLYATHDNNMSPRGLNDIENESSRPRSPVLNLKRPFGSFWFGNKLSKLQISKKEIVDKLENKFKKYSNKWKSHLKLDHNEFNLEVQKSVNELQISEKMKNILFCSISHELRSPVNHINGMLDLIKGSSTDDNIQHFVRIANSSCEMLINKINDILDYSLIETNTIELSNIEFDIRTLLSDIERILSFQYDHQMIIFSIYVSDNVPKFISYDANRLKQVLLNLAFNGIKYTNKGFVTIVVDWEYTDNMEKYKNHKTHHKEFTECLLSFSVSDSGCGIDKRK